MAFVLKAFVARPTLLAWCITGFVVVTIISGIRIYVRVTRQSRLHADDYVFLFGVAIYFCLAALYIADLPHVYAFLDYTSGETPFKPELLDEYAAMMRINFAVTSFFWACLWSVKASLLLFFRRIIKFTDWIHAWWLITAFTGLTFVGCIISQATSCDSVHDFITLGACTSPRETRAQIASLYYSFAADVLTELAIMALPLRVIMNLKLIRRDKISLMCLFSVGIISIIVSFIRVFFIWAKTGSTTPSPAWLGLWAIIECMVALIVGSIPAISQVFRGIGGSSHRADSNAYEQRPVNSSAGNPASWPGRGRKSHLNATRAAAFSSEENLFDDGRQKTEITVTNDEIELGDVRRGRT